MTKKLPYLLALLFLGCRSPLDLSSSWNSSVILIDGSRTEWSDLTTLESPAVSVGARNNGEYLYLCLTTSDPVRQAQVLFAGFTAQFSPAEGREFSVHFPLPQDRPPRAEDRGQFESMFRAFEPRMHSLIVATDGDRQQFGLQQAPGIRVRVGLQEGVLVYELQVPIRQTETSPYAAIPGADGTVAVTFETMPPARDGLPGSGSSRPGGRSRRGPGGGAPTALGGSDAPEPFLLRMNVHLGRQ